MPDINEIHKFFENNLPGYQRRDNLIAIRFFLQKAGYQEKKPIKTFLHNFQRLKEFVCFDWQGESEIRNSPMPKENVMNKLKKKKKMLHHQKLTDKDPMPYGKHQGVKMANVPPDYLLWLFDNDKCSESVKDYVKENKSFLELESKQARKNQNK